MRCNVCDKALSNDEVSWNPEIKAWEMCSVCLDVAMDTAFSQGYNRPDDEITVEVGDEFGDGIIETLDTETSVSVYQWGDASDITGEDDYD